MRDGQIEDDGFKADGFLDSQNPGSSSDSGFGNSEPGNSGSNASDMAAGE